MVETPHFCFFNQCFSVVFTVRGGRLPAAVPISKQRSAPTDCSMSSKAERWHGCDCAVVEAKGNVRTSVTAEPELSQRGNVPGNAPEFTTCSRPLLYLLLRARVVRSRSYSLVLQYLHTSETSSGIEG